jgi:hypothetical protein
MTLERSLDRRREGRGSSARLRPWRRSGGVLPASKGGGLLNRRWGVEAPSSLRRASCRPLLRSTASSLGRRALAGEATTDRRARQCRMAARSRAPHVCVDSKVLGAHAASGRREGALTPRRRTARAGALAR